MVVFSHTQSPVHLHSFAYECPANCFEVTIKRTIEERKGTPGSNWHLGVCIKKSFYIFELKIDKGTETGRHKIHYWKKKSSTPHPCALSRSRICFTLIQPRDVQYTGWVEEVFPSRVHFRKRLLSHVPCVPEPKSWSSEGMEYFANLASISKWISLSWEVQVCTDAAVPLNHLLAVSTGSIGIW